MAQYVCDYAEQILPVFERRFPDDGRLRTAIETAQCFLDGKAALDELRIAAVGAEMCVRDAYAAWSGARSNATNSVGPAWGLWAIAGDAYDTWVVACAIVAEAYAIADANDAEREWQGAQIPKRLRIKL